MDIDEQQNTELPLGEQAYIRLRDLLRHGNLKSGQRLSESEICDRFAMSRTPVREAIRRLQSEGLLGSTPGGRIVVAEIDLERVEEIYDMREAVEGLAARLAARNARTPDLMRLEKILQEQRAEPDTEVRFLNINDRFHGAIYTLSRNRYVIHDAEVLLNSASMIRGSTHGRYDYESWSLQDHEAIFNAICNGDTAGAETAMRQHIRRGRWQRTRLLLAE
ncbi:GntR family transcriptional regulator [Halomonas huangheensis]|uniref:HTH gntR-type domain-containing protein n=1 Tax=Halomonas huangheensis TaxID=1178482 RepID=W1NBD7_9GAMM|nr:GntR family transcriptional regulator [Halomonas huangheensis]ALM52646.1 hypothetical protein AR456_10415 [Halomonas huangheensis]ERL52834.1 hypothetical protein BJB45_16275 [Halomonas huangheensis]